MNKSIIITILLIVVLCLGGYLVCDKVLLNKNDNKDNVVDKEPEKDNSEKYYDLNEAEKLVDIYAGLITYKEIDKEEYYKAFLAYKNLNIKNVMDIPTEMVCEERLDRKCTCTSSWKEVNYDDINQSYKHLFGENSNLVKQDFSAKQEFVLAYSEKYDRFVAYSPTACSGGINGYVRPN